MKVWMLGVPSTFGGGDTERGHTALLWRRAGIEVTCLYFTSCSCGTTPKVPEKSNPWIGRLREAGVEFVAADPERLYEVDGLEGSIVSVICHPHGLHNWEKLCALKCKLVWSPCMTVPSLSESVFTRAPAPKAVHFQSRYQANQLVGEYRAIGCREFRLIRGAFEPLPFNPRPYRPGAPFVVGRLARPARTKWSPYIWDMLAAARRGGVDVRALCQGWSDKLTEHCGPPPDWAEVLPPDTLSAEEFLGRCHAMICPNWGISENWPRVGLEAMSAGVPLVVDGSGGWPEMVGDVAVTCQTMGEYPPAIVKLATDDGFRQTTIPKGRERALKISSPEVISRQWTDLFESL